MEKYTLLTKASLTVEYLDTNSTNHNFLFGAMAELVDNARDADANNLHIFTDKRQDLRGGFSLSFLDDGIGMDPYEVSKIIQFGSSYKRGLLDSNLIGQYGNGLKSGSMRIGNDMILFTKKNSILSICFLSKTFFERENLSDIIVPMPSFDEKTKMPWYEKSADENKNKQILEKHKIELEIILKHSPYKTKEALFAQFDKIQTSSGTLVTIYNLKFPDGKTELDFETDEFDILISGIEVDYDRKRQLEHKSFRHYVSILYLNPKMKIYIQNKKVRTKMLDRCLYRQMKSFYASNKFKKRAEAEAAKAEQELKKLEASLLEANSKLQDYLNKNRNSQPSGYHTELTALRRKKEQLDEDVKLKRREVENKTKSSKDPKKLEFIFGINLHNRNADGLFLYNCNRLIMMFEHTKLQQKDDEYRGIVGIVNIPYLVLEPTNNKQGFQEQTELQSLLKVLNEHMEQYSKELNVVLDHEFWKKYGYSRTWNELPSNDDIFLKIRLTYTQIYVQCDECLIWRKQPFTKDFLDLENYPPENWCCKDGIDIAACKIPTELEQHKSMEFAIKTKPIEETSNAAKPLSTLSAKPIINSFHSKPRIDNQSLVRIDQQSSIKDTSGFKSSKENRSLSTNSLSKKKRRNDDSDEDYESDSNAARAKPKHKTQKDVDRAYSNSYVDRNRFVSNAKKSKSDECPVVTERANATICKTEPEEISQLSQDHLLNELIEIDEIINHQPSSSAEEIRNQLLENEKLTKSISEKLKSLLLRLASTDEETSAYKQEIGDSDANALASFSLNEFMKSYDKAIKRKFKKKIDHEKSRIESILMTIVDKESAEQIIESIYPKFPKLQN